MFEDAFVSISIFSTTMESLLFFNQLHHSLSQLFFIQNDIIYTYVILRLHYNIYIYIARSSSLHTIE
jgi:hypothetical protein